MPSIRCSTGVMRSSTSRHRLALSGVWVLPFARDAEGLTKALFSDWQLNWIFTARTGYPFTVWDCTNGLGSACGPRILTGLTSMRPTAPIDRQPERVFDLLDLTPLVAHAGGYVQSHHRQQRLRSVSRRYDRARRRSRPGLLERRLRPQQAGAIRHARRAVPARGLQPVQPRQPVRATRRRRTWAASRRSPEAGRATAACSSERSSSSEPVRLYSLRGPGAPGPLFHVPRPAFARPLRRRRLERRLEPGASAGSPETWPASSRPRHLGAGPAHRQSARGGAAGVSAGHPGRRAGQEVARVD